MQTGQPTKIEFKKVRDFGQLFTDVFKFLKLNYKSILFCVLMIPGPLFLVAGAFNGYLQSLGTDPSKLIGVGMMRDPWSIVEQLLTFMLPYVIFLVLGSLAATATINRYFILYQEREGNNSIGVGDILKYLLGDMWRLFYNGLLLGLISLLFLILVGIIALIPILGALLIIVALLITAPQIAYAVGAANYLVLRDRMSITTAFSKAWRYMRGNFWWTWVIVVCAGLVVGILSIVFTLPISILSMTKTFSRMNTDVNDTSTVLYVILGTIAVLGPQLLVPISTLFNILTYHSYEEAEEGTALTEKINQMDVNS